MAKNSSEVDLLRSELETLMKEAKQLRAFAEAAGVSASSPPEDFRPQNADILNQELRENYGDAFQVDPYGDWGYAIRRLVDGVRYGERFSSPASPTGDTP